MHHFNNTCPPPVDNSHHLDVSNVAAGFLLILVNAGISSVFGLGLSIQLFVAAIRCVLQLGILGLVFETDSIAFVAMMTISALEISFNKTKARHFYMFPTVWICIVVSVFLASFLGNAFAIQAKPWHQAQQYIPILGMLLGNSLSAVALGLNSALTQLETHKDRIETYLSFGASRWEAIQPVAREAIKTALLPTISQMSVMGLISIPGMMTGQILGGASIDDAVRYQQIILFMITAASSMSATSAVLSCLYICVDEQSRLRLDRIIKVDKKQKPWGILEGITTRLGMCCGSRSNERQPLIQRE
ncbi:hypothetical protein BDR26DRAFT_858070 [Obelidium mucronatum]|nr:hypothetical protein BDR26DRAFT_858070 [Obelidium mucronatum]